ncbi:neuropeptide CCHamide 1 isoform X2 [Leptinotarsa decemlineata]|uniref:neuropeptide CCHamide 1 isoform X2 n=1 Tax=Leptinotarsa decemlineata TaxID=7539 RepID=UPI000C2521EA|nr:uncharacterized protein LOC111504288 [Leptinotarsa decemlineata]
MCNNSGRKELMIKIMAIVSLFCLAEGASGACMTYGHACWGAHGKRSDSSSLPSPKEDHSKTFKSKWFLSRLIQGPMDLRILREGDFDISARNQNIEPLLAIDDVISKQDPWKTNQELIPDTDDQLFDDSFLRAEENNRMRLPKALAKRSTK